MRPLVTDRDEGRITEDSLRRSLSQWFGESPLCVIANREPYLHMRRGNKIEAISPASGLVTALEPIVRACSGLWIGQATGTADRETADKRGIVLVPPQKPNYALKRVWLTAEEEQGFYFGFANEGLWPLCHVVHTRPVFRVDDWNHYVAANKKFRDAFLDEIRTDNAVVLAQDYHFALLPQLLREKRPATAISLFWHIPWSSPDVMRICPWKNELIEGMLGADLIGFQTQYHVNNFLDCVDRFLEARVDRERFSITLRGHTCYVKPFPISVEWPSRLDVPASEIPKIRSSVIEELELPENCLMAVGVDRLDYTKGILERFQAVERLLTLYPNLIGRFVFIQIGAPSRTKIKRYEELSKEIKERAELINNKFHQGRYEPIILRAFHHHAEEIFRFYRASDICVVNSLHDGMNLVAKEYVSSRSDNGGALILSQFTGAARELTDSYLINPYSIDETVRAIYAGLFSDPNEKRSRMERMRSQLSQYNVYLWATRFLEELHHVSRLQRNGQAMAEYETAL